MTSNPGTVYPRVGGATGLTGISIPTCFGLSPRGRGKPWLLSRNRGSSGSIPAWAGQPNMITHTIPPQRVYPRVGGATGGRPAKGGRRAVYPRVGGATIALSWPISKVAGLSPRGRGNPGTSPYYPDGGRSIPAWAGQPGRFDFGGWILAVYPRVGGATTGVSAGMNPHHGSIPAWAGQPGYSAPRCASVGVYPRVGGATVSSVRYTDTRKGLSPRGRGNLVLSLLSII